MGYRGQEEKAGGIAFAKAQRLDVEGLAWGCVRSVLWLELRDHRRKQLNRVWKRSWSPVSGLLFTVLPQGN